MKAVSLTLVVDSYPDTTVKICPSGGFAVACYVSAGKVADDRCEVFTPYGTFTIRGTVDEVSAALESATAPPVAAAVEVAPTDLERAATIVDLLAEASEDEDGELWTCVGVRAVDAALGLGDCGFDDTSRALRALAAKLRGGG